MSDRRRLVLATASAALAGLLGLTACSGDDPRPDADADAVPVVEADSGTDVASPDLGGCPADLVSSIETEHGVSVTVVDLPIVEFGLGVDLPDGAECVVTYPTGAPGELAFEVFWPGEGTAFAEPVGQALLRGGFGLTPGTLSYSNGSRTAEMLFHAAGDADWGDHFGAVEVMQLRGTIEDGGPAAPDADGPDGAVLAWESACMLTVEEVNAATSSAGITVGAPARSTDPRHETCVYSQADATSSPGQFEIYVWPYGPETSFGFAADASWTAPNAAEGAANACAAATATPYVDDLTAICQTVDGVPVVIGSSRLHALVFRPGAYFYSVGVLNLWGTDELTQPLLQMASLLASREPGAR